MKKEKTYWVGFADGKPFVEKSYGEDGFIAIYTKKKDAENYLYDDIRKVRIVEVKK